MSRISVVLMAQYLHVRQNKLGTIIIQAVHILQHDSADTSSVPMKDFLRHNPSYFQITKAGSSTIRPLYQLRRLSPKALLKVKISFCTFFILSVYSENTLKVFKCIKIIQQM
jgi:hypothetical protein